MLIAYTRAPDGFTRSEATPAAGLPGDAVWIDLVSPSADEVRAVETLLGLELPTREEMAEIEISSRLYEEDGALFMTAIVLSKVDIKRPECTAVTFVLAGERLVTIRHADPRPFIVFGARLARSGGDRRAVHLFAGLLEAIIDRTADILELVSAEVDDISREVFGVPTGKNPRSSDFQRMLRRIGGEGDLNSKARESLVSISRLLTFLGASFTGSKETKDLRARLKIMVRDVQSLSDHSSYLTSKITFLLDAILGMINIEQNAIIKIFSVAAVVFLPPTLIASIYGMNFEHMPELGVRFGYPLALGLMVVSAILPCLYFKRRGWL